MPQSPLRPIELQLSNGIPVVLQELEGGVAATYWWNQVGSADELPPEAGFSHFLEHMLFKDAAAKETGKTSTGQIATAIESLGGDINAYTSFDQTVYHVTCAAQHWLKVIDAFGPMAKPQRFLKADFEREREVILEELRKNEDSPGRMMFQELFTQTYRKHPYGRPVIGYVKTLKDARVTDLDAYYRKHYVSSRMGLILVGPVLDERREVRRDLLQRLERYFGKKVIPQRKVAGRAPRSLEPALRPSGPRPCLLPFDVKGVSLALSFRVPDLRHDDVPALDVFSGIVGMGESSRLYQHLFYKKGLVTEVSAGLYVPSDPGMLYAQADFEKIEQIEEVTRELVAELKSVVDHLPTHEELARVITNAESERLYAGQTADGMASRLGFLRFVMGDLHHDREYLEHLKSVSADDVADVARKYLVRERLSAVLMHNRSEKLEGWTGFGRAVELLGTDLGVSAKGKTGKKLPPVSSKDSIESFVTSEGLRVLVHENRVSPVFSAHVSALGGLRGEMLWPVRSAEKDWGASYLFALTATKGTSNRNAREIAAIVEGSAAGLEAFSGRNTLGFQATGLLRDWSLLSKLFSESIADAVFPDEEVEHSKRVAFESIRSIEDHSSQLCSKLFLEQLYGDHPYSRLTTGSLESIEGIDSALLNAYRKRWIRPERMVLALSGGIRRGEVERFANELGKTLREVVGDPVLGKEAERGVNPALNAPRWVEKTLGREQVHIMVGGVGLRLDSPERHAMRLLQTLLGGQSGRLFIELREKKSLAYTVSPMNFEGMEAGYVGTYIASAPAKKDEAIQGIQRVLENFAKKGPTEQEVKRAKEFFLGRRAMDLQSDGAVASHLSIEAVYGLPRRTEDEIAEELKKVTGKQLQDVCRKYLVEAPMVTVAVG